MSDLDAHIVCVRQVVRGAGSSGYRQLAVTVVTSNLTVELTLSQYRLSPPKDTNDNNESPTSGARGRVSTMHRIQISPIATGAD